MPFTVPYCNVPVYIYSERRNDISDLALPAGERERMQPAAEQHRHHHILIIYTY